MLLPVSKLLIIRCVHCETQHYVLFTHTLYPFLYLCKDYHSELGKSISAHSLAVQFKGEKKRESSQVPASLGGWLLPPANSQPPLEKFPQKLQWKDESILPFPCIDWLSVPQDRRFVPLAARIKTAVSDGLIHLCHLAKIY